MRTRLLLLALLTPALLYAQAPPVAAPDTTATPPSAAPSSAPPYRSPFLAFASSFVLFPGVGHVYAGEVETGLLLGGTVLASGYAAGRYGFEGGRCAESCTPSATLFVGLAVATGAALYAHIDAPKAARRFNRRHARPGQSALHLQPTVLSLPGQTRLGLALHVTR